MDFETIWQRIWPWLEKPENWMVIYAAVVSTITLVWNAARDLISLRLRPRVTASVMKGVPGGDLFVYTGIANRSISRPIHVTALITYSGWMPHGLSIWRNWLWDRLGWEGPFEHAIVNVDPPLPRLVAAGQLERLLVPLLPKLMDSWAKTRRIGVEEAGGRIFWATRSSMRQFRRSVRKHQDKKA